MAVLACVHPGFGYLVPLGWSTQFYRAVVCSHPAACSQPHCVLVQPPVPMQPLVPIELCVFLSQLLVPIQLLVTMYAQLCRVYQAVFEAGSCQRWPDGGALSKL
jgi:hypothetical protein